MEKRILLFIVFISIFQNFLYSQVIGDFTAVGDQINYSTTKFLLPDEHKAKLTSQNYDKFILDLEKIGLKDNIAIAKDIEFKKKEIRKGFAKEKFSALTDELITFCLSKLKNTTKAGKEDDLKAELLLIKTTALDKFKKSEKSKTEDNDDNDKKDDDDKDNGQKNVVITDNTSKFQDQISDLRSELDELKKELKKGGKIVETPWYFILSGILGLVLSIICFFLILKLRKNKVLDKRIDERIMLVLDKFNKTKDTDSNKKGTNYTQQPNFVTFDNLNQKIESLRKELKEAINKKIEKESPVIQNYQNVDNYSKESEIKKPYKESYQVLEESFYLKMPDASGSFWSEQKTNNMDSETFFIVTVEKNNPTRGKFKPISDETLQKRAIMDFDITLKPVCVVEGNYNQQGTKIQLVSEGYLKLIGDKWELDDNRKCKIRIV